MHMVLDAEDSNKTSTLALQITVYDTKAEFHCQSDPDQLSQ